jgi:nucleotide-binding universal stress UspA family protein
MLRKVLVALDGSDHAAKALDLAIDLANIYNAELVALSVATDSPATDEERRLAQSEYRDEVQQALTAPSFALGPRTTESNAAALVEMSTEVGLAVRRAIGRQVTVQAEMEARKKGVANVRVRVESGDPASTIVSVAAAEKPDMLVMGSRGLGDIQGLLMGSVSHKVSHLAPCTVVTVK